MYILNESLVREAIDISLPSIEATLRKYESLHSPSAVYPGVVIVVRAKALDYPYVYVMGSLNKSVHHPQDLIERWKNQACEDSLVAICEGKPSSEVERWNLKWYEATAMCAVAKDSGLSVAAAGMYDKIVLITIAWIVFNVIEMLCNIKILGNPSMAEKAKS